MVDDTPDGPEEVPNLRFLKGLVTILTITMIGGVLTIVALLVIRLGDSGAVTLPEAITLPSGEEAVAFTQAPGWYAVVTDDNEILVFSRATGELTQRVQITTD